MVVIDTHNVILHYGISQPMSSVTPVEALSSKKPIKMEQRKKFCSNETCPTRPPKKTRKKKTDDAVKKEEDTKSE